MEGIVGLLVPFILVGGVMWFFMIRPQKKRQEETTKNVRFIATR